MQIQYIIIADEVQVVERSVHFLAVSQNFSSKPFPTNQATKTLIVRLAGTAFDRDTTTEVRVLMIDPDGNESLLGEGTLRPRFDGDLPEGFAFIPVAIEFLIPGHHRIKAILENGSEAELQISVARRE